MTNIIKISKKILITILVLQIIFAIINISQAVSISNIIESGDNFLAIGKGQADVEQDTSNIKDIISYIFSIIFPLGVAITVIVGGVLGIKFMLASAEDKAKIKEMLVPYTVGCILIFGATGIWNLVVNIGGQIVEDRSDLAKHTQKLAQLIIDGTLDITELSNEQVKNLYTSQYVGDDLHNLTTSDPRAGGKDTVYTLEEAIDQLSSYKRKIYDEAKRRNLLDSEGIYLKK